MSDRPATTRSRCCSAAGSTAASCSGTCCAKGAACSRCTSVAVWRGRMRSCAVGGFLGCVRGRPARRGRASRPQNVDRMAAIRQTWAGIFRGRRAGRPRPENGRDSRSRPLVVLDLPVDDLYGDHWSITGDGVPDVRSADDAVYLPGRNALLLVKAAIWCRLHGIGELALAVLRSNPFADATPEFFAEFESAIGPGCGRTRAVCASLRRDEQARGDGPGPRPAAGVDVLLHRPPRRPALRRVQQVRRAAGGVRGDWRSRSDRVCSDVGRSRGDRSQETEDRRQNRGTCNLKSQIINHKSEILRLPSSFILQSHVPRHP